MGLHAILIDSCPEGLASTACHDCCSRDAPGVKNPVQGQRCFLIFDSCGECMEFLPPEEKSWVFWNGRAVLPALSFQSPLLRVGSASYGKGKDSAPGTSVQWALSSDTCRAVDTAAAASPMEAGRSRSQNRALAAHTTPRGRPRTKQSTEKVERLRDNRRGLGVVIYNRDCKTVNEIWS